MAASSLSPVTTGLLSFLAYGRIAVGLGCLLLPSQVGRLTDIPLAAGSGPALITQLHGAREIGIGALTSWVKPNGSSWKGTESDRIQLRNVLWANVLVDCLDVALVGWTWASGGVGAWAGVLAGGGAVWFASMGLLALRGVPA